ncbi:type III PLP-dependent enzyme [Paractinoplanes ferrugineus]|uniref:ornithine decarboxylase n=1 Tax=Paractinoplanes ferrugineus TaxID=113564 RepID=A0A919J5B6_9ACTN|nr:type III PLP-dependent enzyme [Actinoplanes ferrugineus]GIE15116.1 ornithine decarboxylase [Actinoplanes ferrugineus]
MISSAVASVLSADMLRVIDVPTPYLVTDLDTVADRYAAFTTALPGVRAHYAMKCNSSPEILRTLADAGAGFEISSIAELRMLQAQGVDPAGVLYSHPVKAPGMIAAAAGAGLFRFAFDSPGELAKIAENAPGAACYVRLRVDDSTSVFPAGNKFGTDLDEAYDLMLLARRMGLRPYGVTFHVGSQCQSTGAWRSAIRQAGALLERLLDEGIELTMLDLGGGFPARYGAGEPSIEQLGEVVEQEIALLPYRPALLTAEPGRFLVAEASVLAAKVIGRELRGTEHWLYVEVGAYHGLMEPMQSPGGWDYPMSSSVAEHAEQPTLPFTIAGPSGHATDVVGYAIPLPAGLTVGDVLYFGSAGAYTLAYASNFNGFAPPTPVFVGGVR